MAHLELPQGKEFVPQSMPPVGSLTDAGSILSMVLEWLKNMRDKCNTGIKDANDESIVAKVERLDGSVVYYGEIDGTNTFPQDGDTAYNIVRALNHNGVSEETTASIVLPTKTSFMGQFQGVLSRVTFGRVRDIAAP